MIGGNFDFCQLPTCVHKSSVLNQNHNHLHCLIIRQTFSLCKKHSRGGFNVVSMCVFVACVKLVVLTISHFAIVNVSLCVCVIFLRNPRPRLLPSIVAWKGHKRGLIAQQSSYIMTCYCELSLFKQANGCADRGRNIFARGSLFFACIWPVIWFECLQSQLFTLKCARCEANATCLCVRAYLCSCKSQLALRNEPNMLKLPGFTRFNGLCLQAISCSNNNMDDDSIWWPLFTSTRNRSNDKHKL